MSVAAMATLVHIILFREAIVISRRGSLVRVTAGVTRTVPSARVIDLRPPNGLPFRAGMNFTVNCSPILSAFGPTLLIPRSASAVAEPVVNVQSVVVPSAFFTVTTIDPCGFTNWMLGQRARDFPSSPRS